MNEIIEVEEDSLQGFNIPPQECEDAVDNTIVFDIEEEERRNAENKFIFAKELFPDIDEMFLRAKCAEFAFDDSSFYSFFNNTILSGDYPKEPDVLPQVEQFIVDNNTFEALGSGIKYEDYLKKYPDPMSYFENYTGGDRYIKFSLIFLLWRYKLISKAIVSKVLQKNKYNLFMADLELGKMKASRKIVRALREIPPIDQQPPPEFIDEVYFILKKENLILYHQDKTEARNAAVEEARKANALLTCLCCYDDECLTEEISTCSDGHIYCRNCIRRNAEILMGDGKLDFPCLVNCKGSFQLHVLKEIISETLFDRLEKKLQEREVLAANIPGLERCAFCEYAAIPDPGTRIFECDNCKKQTCRSCRKESHIPFTCEEVIQNNAMHDRMMVEEKMTEALLRSCYMCGAKFIRDDGCNKVRCDCGAQMCYICRKPVKSYAHFYDKKNERLPNQCPLYTNNEEVHKKVVDEAGRQAIAELKRKNPDLDYLLYNKKK